jgi:hypothetical protein
MDNALWGLIGTFLGIIIGSATSIITTLINNKSANKFQINAKKYRLAEQFREFQFKTVLDIQTQLADAMRNVGQYHFHLITSLRKHGKLMPLDEPLNENLRESFQELSLLTERISNDELREKLINIKIEMGDCTLAETEESADLLVQKCLNTYKTIIPEIGSELRSTYSL